MPKLGDLVYIEFEDAIMDDPEQARLDRLHFRVMRIIRELERERWSFENGVDPE